MAYVSLSEIKNKQRYEKLWKSETVAPRILNMDTICM
jgi:hypothetical protein